MIIRRRQPKNFFNEYGLYSSGYSILDVMQLLGVEIVSTSNKKYGNEYILILSVPEYYDLEFFGKINSKDICNFLEEKIKSELPENYIVGILLAQGNKFNKYWTDIDYFDAKYKIIWKDREKFINMLENDKPILVPVKKKRF